MTPLDDRRQDSGSSSYYHSIIHPWLLQRIKLCQEVPLTYLYMQDASCLSRADHSYLTVELVSLIPDPVKQEQTPAQSKTPKVGQQHPVDHPVKLV